MAKKRVVKNGRIVSWSVSVDGTQTVNQVGGAFDGKFGELVAKEINTILSRKADCHIRLDSFKGGSHVLTITSLG